MFIPGVSTPTYTKEQLKELNDKEKEKFNHKGKKYTAYEASQYQRKIETAMRDAKRTLIGYKEAGLEEDFKQESIRLQRLKAEYKEFSSKAGLRIKDERAQVVGFNRSIAQKASNAAKKK